MSHALNRSDVPAHPRWFKWAAMVCGVLLAALIAEVGAWFYYYQYFLPNGAPPLGREHMESIEFEDPELFWRFRPNVKGFRRPGEEPYPVTHIYTNQYGLRDDLMGVPKPSTTFRVICIGESTTIGDGVEAEEAYPHRLEKLLNDLQSGWRYDVVNAGHGSYTSFQGRRLLELFGDEWEPDMVITYHEVTDTFPTGHRHSKNSRLGLGYTDKELYAKLQLEQVSSRARARDALLRWSWFAWLIHLGAFDRSRVPEEDQQENYEAILAMCRRWGAQLIVLHPIFDIVEHHECGLTRFTTERGVPLVELLDAWSSSGLTADQMFLDGTHPTPAGHDVIARAIFDYLVEHRMLPETAPPIHGGGSHSREVPPGSRTFGTAAQAGSR